MIKLGVVGALISLAQVIRCHNTSHGQGESSDENHRTSGRNPERKIGKIFGKRWYRKSLLEGIDDLLDETKRLQNHNWSNTQTFERKPDEYEREGNSHRFARTPDGKFNNPDYPCMGSANTNFARNAPFHTAEPEAEGRIRRGPNPHEISNKLMTRKEFKPATTINLLAAAWVQFQVHDWFNHRKVKTREGGTPWEITSDDGKTVIEVEPTFVTKDGNYVNTQVQWWDGSQIYGSNSNQVHRLRTWEGGKLIIGENGLLVPEDESDKVGFEKTGFTDNWWLGLRLFHTLFTLEHNSICDMLKACHPQWSDNDIFDHARLINSALMAKIHTVEWTPAMLDNSIMKILLKADWCGITPDDIDELRGWISCIKPEDLRSPLFKLLFQIFLKRKFGWLLDWIGRTPRQAADIYEDEDQGVAQFLQLLMDGTPKRKLDVKTEFIDETQYAMTEEFVAVYRMHPLVPDKFDMRHLKDDTPIDTLDERIPESYKGEKWTFSEISLSHTLDIDEKGEMEDLFYSFGTSHPGELALENFPSSFQNLTLPVKQHEFPIDLAAVDIFRDRERGLPRYNDFREMIYGDAKRRFNTFEEVTGNDANLAKKIRDVYGETDGKDNVDDLDLMVGLLSEPFPPGYAFSETTFQVFALMTPFRLKSDRLFTSDYNEKRYTKEGIDWIENNTMSSVLTRHYKELGSVLKYVNNAFKPWPRVNNSCHESKEPDSINASQNAQLAQERAG